ncbi:hypothetical protein BC826DRAFT_1108803 [Russula brevipes]|nr:hypothetical protein BC826DRAFT_1108803 [Russula brevipes]
MSMGSVLFDTVPPHDDRRCAVLAGPYHAKVLPLCAPPTQSINALFDTLPTLALGPVLPQAPTVPALAAPAILGLHQPVSSYPACPGAFPAGTQGDILTPSDFSIPYTDLELTTPDVIKIKGVLVAPAAHPEH